MIEQFHKNPTQQKDQFVVAYIADLEQSHAVVSYALYFTRMLKKGLILLHVSDPRYTAQAPAEAEPRLQQIRRNLPQGDAISYAALKGNTKEVINVLPTLLNAVLVVAHVSANAKRKSPTHPKRLLRDFSECKVAYLTVQEPMVSPRALSNVAFTVNYKKEAKDKYIWSSYFARFFGSTVHALHYDYTDEILKRKWYDNMRFLHRLYAALGINFTSHVITSKSTFEDINALHFSVDNHYDLLLCLTTKERDALELFIGVQENYLVVNSHHLPILFLNPREDLYVICD
ncbi:MAG: hypothetical protein SPJ13_05795 [Bacteroidales bacterium]|nr:hypothetical protein [Bacteroidales bacterium]